MSAVINQSQNFSVAIQVAAGGFICHALVCTAEGDWVGTTTVHLDPDCLASYVRRVCADLLGPFTPTDPPEFIGPLKVEA